MTQTNPEPSDQKTNLSQENNNEIHEQKKIPLTSATTKDEPSFGWSAYAERVNGRFAMIGLCAILLIEAFSKSTFLHWAGLMQ